MAKFLSATLAGLVLLGLGTTPALAGKAPKGDKARDPEAKFKKLDANDDGSLTLVELNRKGKKDADEVKAKFAKLDKDSDQKVTLAELKARGKKGDGKPKKKPSPKAAEPKAGA